MEVACGLTGILIAQVQQIHVAMPLQKIVVMRLWSLLSSAPYIADFKGEYPLRWNIMLNRYQNNSFVCDIVWLDKELINKLTNSAKQSPSSEPNSHPATQEISRLLWNPKVHYRVHNSLPPIPILRQMNLVHSCPHYFSNIISSIVIPSTPKSSEWSLPFGYSDQNFVCIYHLSHPCYIPSPFNLLDLITLIIFDEAYMLRSSSLCSLLQSPTTSSLLGPNILLSTLFSNTLILCSSFSVKEQVSHPN